MSTQVRATSLTANPSMQTPELAVSAPPFARIGIQAVAAAADQLKRAEAAAKARAEAGRELPPALRAEFEAL